MEIVNFTALKFYFMKKVFSITIILLISVIVTAQQDSSQFINMNAEIFKSVQEVSINGKNLAFNAEAGTHKLRDENDEPIALFGYTSYFKKDEKSLEKRPIVFAFNGGPLSASVWLHMGILGPKRVVVKDPSTTPNAPYEIVNNEHSILDVADLVMIDPVGVGLSKPIGKSKWEDFWGVDQDIRSIALFIEQYLIEKERMNHPKFLLGESYGTFRNAGLMNKLQNNGISMNGVIMVSSLFDFNTVWKVPGSDLSFITRFPSFATSAWYHKKLVEMPDDFELWVEEVRTFTEDEYSTALLKGDQLSDEEKDQIASKLASYSGLSKDIWLKTNLRISNSEFYQLLLKDEGLTLGRLDARFTGINQDYLSQYADYDPLTSSIGAPFRTAFREYLYNDLNVRKDVTYTMSAWGRKGWKWDWDQKGNKRLPSTSGAMAECMIKNPNTKVLILNGYFDLATAFYGVEYSINHMQLPVEIKANISMKYYMAGHMMYTHDESMVLFKQHVSEFIKESLK